MAVLRSFGVVGALAAAALALVIGIFAFNAHSNHNKPPAMGGPSQSGIANHAAVATTTGSNTGAVLVAKPAPSPSASAVASSGQTYQVNTSSGVVMGGQAYVAPAAVPRCGGGGVLGGLVGLLGGLLGGGGGC
ncbi:MAG TPA: hypothetical protein VGH89_07245 [Pseudonocardia sp.]|jgi:hypothetical protein